MKAVMEFTVELHANGGRAIADIDLEGEFRDGQLIAIRTDMTGWFTEGYVVASNDLVAKALWLAAVQWADAQYRLVQEIEHEQQAADIEEQHERKRQYAA